MMMPMLDIFKKQEVDSIPSSYSLSHSQKKIKDNLTYFKILWQFSFDQLRLVTRSNQCIRFVIHWWFICSTRSRKHLPDSFRHLLIRKIPFHPQGHPGSKTSPIRDGFESQPRLFVFLELIEIQFWSILETFRRFFRNWSFQNKMALFFLIGRDSVWVCQNKMLISLEQKPIS